MKLKNLFKDAVSIEEIDSKEYDSYFLVGNEAIKKNKVISKKVQNLKRINTNK